MRGSSNTIEHGHNESHPTNPSPMEARDLETNPSNSHLPMDFSTMEVHKVNLPPHESSLEKFRAKCKETFFPDDPLRQFKGQSCKRKWILGAQYIFPILQWGPNYSLKLFKSDIVSGLTIASLAIPQGISYAKLANLPPIVGLYSSFVPPLVYAVLGSSRDLAVGPVSIASLILGSMLRQEVSPTEEPILFLQLAFTTTFFAGLFQASLGILRLGFIIDLLSKATLMGFMAGAAIIVSLQQLKSLLGIVHFTNQMSLVPVMSSVFHRRDEWSWETILMGVSFLIFLLVARHVSLRNPKLFWVSAAAPLVCVILATLLVFTIKAQNHGISIVGFEAYWESEDIWYAGRVFIFQNFQHVGLTVEFYAFQSWDILADTFTAYTDDFVFPLMLTFNPASIGRLQHGLNPPSLNMLLFRSNHLPLVIKTGLTTGIISLTEGIAVGRTFASLKNYKVDGNKEMMAIGLMNVVGSCTSCYITTGAFSRSAVNHNAGSKTAMSNIVMAVTVMITLLFLMPLFLYTPNLVLGAIIVTAVVGLIDIPATYVLWKIDKIDFIICVSAFLGVIFISVVIGLAIAIGISILRILLQVTRPKTVILGKIPGTDIYRNIHHYREATRIPGFLILSIEAPVNFANTAYLTERISRSIEEEAEDEGKPQGLHFVILDMSGVSAIDTSGISLLTDLKNMTEKQGLEFALVNPVGGVLVKLQRANHTENFMGAGNIYLTIGEAVISLSSMQKEDASNHV